MDVKRMTAHIANVDEIVTGKFVKKTGFESNYILTRFGRKISRARVMGVIVDIYKSADMKYAALTIDDSTNTLRAKAFVNIIIFDNFKAGDLIDLVGKVREYNDEIYIIPEILRKVSPNQEILRGLELKKIYIDQVSKIRKLRVLQKQSSDLSELKVLASKSGIGEEIVEGILEADELIKIDTEVKTQESSQMKDKILELVEKLDEGKGAEYQNILTESKIEEEKVDSAIQELLEEGVCFEPKAGMIKKL
jgi:uncharacterized protein